MAVRPSESLYYRNWPASEWYLISLLSFFQDCKGHFIMSYFFGGSKIGMPSCIGYFSPHFAHTSFFLSFVYSRSALQSGHASTSNSSFGIGSCPVFCSDFAIFLHTKTKDLNITSCYFFINLVKVIDFNEFRV